MTAGGVDGVEPLVLHRLALAVEPLDAVTRSPAGSGVRVGWEQDRPPGRRPGRDDPPDPLDPLGRSRTRTRTRALETNGTAAFKLRYTLPHGRRAGTIRPRVPAGRPPGTPPSVVVLVDDPRRRYTPRRFEVQLWTLVDVEAVDRPAPAGGVVPGDSRLLRPWLLPGAAYPASRTATGVRGRVATPAGVPVPWPRIEALGPGNLTVGRAHGDERGEFLLLITGTGTLAPPPPARLTVRLVVHGPAAAAPGAPPIELVPRSSAPTVPGDLDNPLLRGETVPDGYQESAARPPLSVPVGRIHIEHAPIRFSP
jgi:hypothetical protein